MEQTITVVEFTRPVPPYHASERAGFPAGVADSYVRAGAARVIKSEVPRVSEATIKERQDALRAEREVHIAVAPERQAAARTRAV